MTTATERQSHGGKVQVKVRLPKAIKAKLDECAATAGVSLSTIIQVALGKAVSEWRHSHECSECQGHGCGVCGGTGRVS